MSECENCTALRAENERLRVQKIQMQAALGYGIMAEDERHILPSNPYKCGTCDANKHIRVENERLDAELKAARDELGRWLCGVEIKEMQKEIERLKAAMAQAIRQHEEGNKGLSHYTLCDALYGRQA